MHWLLAPFLILASLYHAWTYEAMVDRVSSSVVRITGQIQERAYPLGVVDTDYVCTGEVIDIRGAKYVLTAAHCVGHNIFADGVPVADVVADDMYFDLALLSVPTVKDPLTFRDSDVSRYEPLTAIGYGFGYTKLTVLQVIPFLIHSAPPWDRRTAVGLVVQGTYIPGMSGGVVVDRQGQIVGMVQQSGEGVGYGVEVSIIRAFLLGL